MLIAVLTCICFLWQVGVIKW